MSVINYLKISTHLLPISDEEKHVIGEDRTWLTKDIVNWRLRVNITDEGLLQVQDGEDSEMRIVPFHGFLEFYCTTDEDSPSERFWFFSAKFTDDKLVAIKQLKEAMYWTNRTSLNKTKHYEEC